MRRDLSGILILDKPKGISSNDALQQAKRRLNARKAGHAGTLDPLATGVLPILLGQATKFSQFLLETDKRYLTTAKLGETTDTGDAMGEIVATKSADSVDWPAIQTALLTFCGEITQTPPMYSAIKHQGRPLYEYAREGIPIERKSRQITIYECLVLTFEPPCLTLKVHCSKGTYIRTLVSDLGDRLGCGAHVQKLRRTHVGQFSESSAHQLSDLTTQITQADLLPIDAVIEHLPKQELNPRQTQAMHYGQVLSLPVTPHTQPGLVRLYQAAQFIGVGEITAKGQLKASRLLALGE